MLSDTMLKNHDNLSQASKQAGETSRHQSHDWRRCTPRSASQINSKKLKNPIDNITHLGYITDIDRARLGRQWAENEK